MGKRIFILGHSFARRLERVTGRSYLDYGVLANLGCTRDEVYFITSLHDRWGHRLENIKFNLIQDVLDHWYDILCEYGRCDVLILLLGSNDVASRPTESNECISGLLLLANTFRRYMARRIAFVEVIPRYSPGGFPVHHCPDFQVDDIQSPEEVDQMFKEKATNWNTLLKKYIKGNPDFHWITMKGLRGEDRIDMDGIHFTDASQQDFAKSLKRRIYSLASPARDIPGLDY